MRTARVSPDIVRHCTRVSPYRGLAQVKSRLIPLAVKRAYSPPLNGSEIASVSPGAVQYLREIASHYPPNSLNRASFP